MDGPGSSVGTLNLSYQRQYFDFIERGERTGPGGVDRVRVVTATQRGYEYEMGGDYEFALGPGRLKLIGLNRFEHDPGAQTVVTSFADWSPDVGNRFARIGDEKEQIARAEYRLKRGGADWQLSAEGAFNSLDNVSELFVLRPDGAFEEIPLPGGTATVKEDRYEVLASYGRPLSSKLSIQLSAGGEYSYLRQIGANGLSRTFWRPKGLLSLAWKPIPRLDLNLKLQRRVGQLNFFDFLASENLQNENRNAGNPELVPPQNWELDVEAIRNLGRHGTTSLRLYGRLIEDIVDVIPIDLTGESPGNIDRAPCTLGMEEHDQLRSDGLAGCQVRCRGSGAGKQAQGPAHRRAPADQQQPAPLHRCEPQARRAGHTLGLWRNLGYRLAALNYRLTEVGRQWEGPVFAGVFAEHKDVLGLTVRGSIFNALGGTSMWDRIVYVGRRTGPIAFREIRDRRIGPIFSFSISGKF